MLQVDVVGFSLMPADMQVEVVCGLWDVLYRLTKDDPSLAFEVQATGTGDGHVTLATQSDANKPFGEFILLACKLIEEVHRDMPDVQFRAAVNSGEAHKLKTSFNSYEWVSHSINQLARIVDYGAPGQIVISQSFADGWRAETRTGVSARIRFVRSLVQPPLDSHRGRLIRVKHGDFMQVHHLDVPNITRTAGAKINDRMGTIQYARQQLIAELIAINEALLDLFERKRRLGARLSILAKSYEIDDDSGKSRAYLFATDIRVIGGRHADSGLGLTKYWLDGPQVGPVKCWNERNPVVVLGLPPRSRNWNLYRQRIIDEWGCDDSDIKNWSRFPRTFIAFPFGMLNLKSNSPDGIVCLDMMDSFEDAEEGTLQHLGIELQKVSLQQIAPFWRLYTNT